MFSARHADRDRSDIPLRANPDDPTDRSVHRDPEQLVQNDGCGGLPLRPSVGILLEPRHATEEIRPPILDRVRRFSR
jgi:hypothetical protein